MKGTTRVFLVTISLFLIISITYKKIYSFEKFPNGKIRKSATFLPFKNLYRVKMFYENGDLEALFYQNYGKNEGVMRIYNQKGSLKAINYFKDGKKYYSEVYTYDSLQNNIDSEHSLFPIIFGQNRYLDSIEFKVGVIIEGLQYSCDSLEFLYDLYDFRRKDGLFLHPPKHEILIPQCEIQDIKLSLKSNMDRKRRIPNE